MDNNRFSAEIDRYHSSMIPFSSLQDECGGAERSLGGGSYLLYVSERCGPAPNHLIRTFFYYFLDYSSQDRGSFVLSFLVLIFRH